MKEIYRLRDAENESTAMIRADLNPDRNAYVGFVSYYSHGRILFTERCRVERVYAMDALADARRIMNDQGEWIPV
jgi:SRSO17 transposase